MTPRSAFTFHAERLERDDVWHAVRRVARTFGARGRGLTFFVHPLTAIEADVDLAPRLAELAQAGHEIAQHTHYYRDHAEGPGGLVKTTSLDDATVLRCLDRDFDYLSEAGHRPRGFVGGGWAVSATALAWLQERSFAYDCTYRTFRLGYDNPLAAPGDDAPGPSRIGSLVELPTTSTFSAEIRRPFGGHDTASGSVRYRLSYMHDTDLLGWKDAALRRLRPLLVRRYRHVTAGQVVRELGDLRQGAR